jgi:hypothetical protein
MEAFLMLAVIYLALTVLGLVMFLLQNRWRWHYTGRTEEEHLQRAAARAVARSRRG